MTRDEIHEHQTQVISLFQTNADSQIMEQRLGLELIQEIRGQWRGHTRVPKPAAMTQLRAATQAGAEIRPPRLLVSAETRPQKPQVSAETRPLRDHGQEEVLTASNEKDARGRAQAPVRHDCQTGQDLTCKSACGIYDPTTPQLYNENFVNYIYDGGTLENPR